MEILKKPILTEKISLLTDKLNHYAFKVDQRANKIEIRKAVQDMYGVTVEAVNTMRYSGKLKSRNTKGGMVSGRASKFKKAIITVKGGEAIDYYNNI